MTGIMIPENVETALELGVADQLEAQEDEENLNFLALVTKVLIVWTMKSRQETRDEEPKPCLAKT